MANLVGRVVVCACLSGIASLTPRAASACGGTFCDRQAPGTPPMPVDQKGENILFVMDGGNVEAHVQIKYEGEAQKFAWIIPVPALPEVEVGSQPLFGNLMNATVPMFGFTSTSMPCGGGGGPAPCSNPCGRCSGTGGGSAGGEGFGPGSSPPAAPEVVLRDAVGAFDVAVLEGGTAATVSDWLVQNGYQQNDAAPQILESYLRQNYLFIAIKLNGRAGVDEIHPIVIRYPGTEPCVPLKLTAIAAVENMGVRAFFLGRGRVVPTNYKHLRAEPAAIRLALAGRQLRRRDCPSCRPAVANGRAFVTEYAGPSNVVMSAGIFSDTWNAAPFQTLVPEGVIDVLESQKLLTCNGKCTSDHPQLLPLLHEFLPTPAGLERRCASTAASPATPIESIARLSTAASSQRRWPNASSNPAATHATCFLACRISSRLYTELSPVEMTEDPMFHERADLPVVRNVLSGSTVTDCSGRTTMTLPDRRTVVLMRSSPLDWPTFTPDMPWVRAHRGDPSRRPADRARGQQGAHRLAAQRAQPDRRLLSVLSRRSGGRQWQWWDFECR